jgi:hypothetical protein
MTSLETLLHEHSNFSLPTQLRLGAPFGMTTLCFQNFYSELFPERDTPVDLHVVCFSEEGEQLDGTVLRVETGEFVQYTPDAANRRGTGLIAAAAIPAFDLARYSAGKLKIRSEIGTGFYVIWDDGSGHLDTMHEWMAVSRRPLPPARHYFVFDSACSRLGRFGLALVNPVVGSGCESQATVSIFDSTRRSLGSARLEPVPSMGTRMVFFDAVFPGLGSWFRTHGPLGVEVSGANLVEPLTVEIHRSGDVHIHHIN